MQLIHRHGLLTVPMVQAVRMVGESAALKALQLTGFKHHPLIHPRRYWAPRAYGPQALPTVFSLAAYCLMSDPRRERVSSNLITSGEALCFAGGLEAVRVDLGGSADHIARKVERFADANEQHDLSRLTYVVLCPCPEKARAVERSLARELPFKTRAVVIPDLFYLLSHTHARRTVR